MLSVVCLEQIALEGIRWIFWFFQLARTGVTGLNQSFLLHNEEMCSSPTKIGCWTVQRGHQQLIYINGPPFSVKSQVSFLFTATPAFRNRINGGVILARNSPFAKESCQINCEDQALTEVETWNCVGIWPLFSANSCFCLANSTLKLLLLTPRTWAMKKIWLFGWCDRGWIVLPKYFD